MSTDVKPYKYFDTPDGEDIFQKLWFVLKPTGITALGISTIDVMLYSHPKGYLPTLARYAFISFPLISMSTAFVVTTNLSASIRGQDDKFNWLAGAWSAGGVFGVWRKSPVAGFAACAVFSAAALLKKHAVQENWNLFPSKVYQAHGGLNMVRHDWTLIKERPRNWTTGNAE